MKNNETTVKTAGGEVRPSKIAIIAKKMATISVFRITFSNSAPLVFSSSSAKTGGEMRLLIKLSI
jgi:hypothetical protein